MGKHDPDQGHVAEPARPPLSAARAREMTAELREAMDDVRRFVALLAARVHDAHTTRVWVPPGHGSWEAYCDAEFGISRAQAYRLLDVARSLTAIHGAVTTSRTPDNDPDGAAALHYGLRQRALITVSGHSGDVAELFPRRLAALAAADQALDEATVRAVARQAAPRHPHRAAPALRRCVGGRASEAGADGNDPVGGGGHRASSVRVMAYIGQQRAA
ncbi:hypothetical protein ACWCPJ_37230 [Streptomyces collinus]